MRPPRKLAVVSLALLATLLAGAPPAPGLAAEAPPDTTAAGRSARETRVREISRIVAEADSVVKAQGGPRADNAQLFLSWNAPWGFARAQRVRMPACADSSAEDTLFLSFLAGRSAQRFTGFTGQLLFHATGADTLGSWWHMESRGGENAGSLRVEWPSPGALPGRSPFRVPGQGIVLLDHTPQAARLRMVFAVPYDGAAPVVPDSIYVLGRVILRHRPARALAGCEQPVVVEWAASTLAFGPKDEPAVRRGERFVTWSGPWALVEPFRGPRVEPWRPPRPGAR